MKRSRNFSFCSSRSAIRAIRKSIKGFWWWGWGQIGFNWCAASNTNACPVRQSIPASFTCDRHSSCCVENRTMHELFSEYGQVWIFTQKRKTSVGLKLPGSEILLGFLRVILPQSASWQVGTFPGTSSRGLKEASGGLEISNSWNWRKSWASKSGICYLLSDPLRSGGSLTIFQGLWRVDGSKIVGLSSGRACGVCATGSGTYARNRADRLYFRVKEIVIGNIGAFFRGALATKYGSSVELKEKGCGGKFPCFLGGSNQ